MEKLNGHFQIAEPCHEDWNKMTPESQGRFCASCQKCVVDFSKMSFPEMVEVYEKAEGNVCGRVRPEQLGKPVADAQSVPSRSMLSKLQKFAMAMLLAFGLAGFSAQAQTPKPEKTESKIGEFIMGQVMVRQTKGIVRGSVDTDGRDPEVIYISLTSEKWGEQRIEMKHGDAFTFMQVEDGSYTLRATDNFGRSSTRQVVVEHGKEVVQNLVLRPMMLGKIAYVPQRECEIPKNPRATVQQPESNSAVTEQQPEVVQTKVEEPEIAVQQSLEMKVFPNPSSDVLKLQLLSDPKGAMSVCIFDLEGKLVLRESLQGDKGQIWNLDVSGLGMGTYLLEFRSGKARKREKILLI